MKLTSYERMRRYLAGEGNADLTDNVYNKRDLQQQIAGVSALIENTLAREIEYKYREEYLDILDKNQEIFFVKAYPIASISYCQYDSSGYHISTPTVLTADEYYIGASEDYIQIDTVRGFETKRALKIGYTGGLAMHGYISQYTIASVSGSVVPDTFVIGQSSGAGGIVRAVDGAVIETEILYGVFDEGESLHFHANEDESDISGVTATLQNKDTLCLAESYPAITLAAEIETRYRWKHKHDYENISTNKDSTNRRIENRYSLQPEAMHLLSKYINTEIY